jgi:hypothetical protein
MTRDELELEQMRATTANLMAETAKFIAEGEKYRRESKWLPIAYATAFVGAVLALAKLWH